MAIYTPVFFSKLQVFNSSRKGSRPSQPVAHNDSKSATGSSVFNSTTKAKLYITADRLHLLVHASFFRLFCLPVPLSTSLDIVQYNVLRLPDNFYN